MDKYCIKMLSLIRDYEIRNGKAIGIQTLDRKFYNIFSYQEVQISDTIEKLRKKEMLLNNNFFKISDKGKQFLSDHQGEEE